MSDPPFDFLDKVDTKSISQMAKIADQVRNRVGIAGFEALLEIFYGLGGAFDVFVCLAHILTLIASIPLDAVSAAFWLLEPFCPLWEGPTRILTADGRSAEVSLRLECGEGPLQASLIRSRSILKNTSPDPTAEPTVTAAKSGEG
jgi:hypothetical protein